MSRRRLLVAGLVALAVSVVGTSPAAAGLPRIALTRIDFGAPQIESSVFTVRADGSGARRVTSGLNDSNPDWSPDRSRIAFDRRGARFHIWTIAASGHGARRVSDGRDELEPAWSPDARLIAYSGRTGPYPGDDDESDPFDVFAVRPDGSGGERITHGPGAERSPTWSPGGGSLAYARDVDGRAPRLYRIRADGTHPRRLTRMAAREPAWSPDGRYIAFVAFRTGGGGVFVVPAEGGSARLVSHGPGVVAATGPAWSPNSRRIVFEGRNDDTSRAGIFAVRANGTGQHLIVRDRTDLSFLAPDW